MALRRYAGEGEMIPGWWYAVAWREFDTNRSVCYPVGLHFLMRWARGFWYWLRWTGLGAGQKAERKVWLAGYEMGARMRARAEEEAYHRGWQACFDQLIRGRHRRQSDGS